MRQIRDLMEPRLAGFFMGIPVYADGMFWETDGPKYIYDHEGD